MPNLLSKLQTEPVSLLSRPAQDAERPRPRELRSTDPVYGCVEWYQYDRATAADRTKKRRIRH